MTTSARSATLSLAPSPAAPGMLRRLAVRLLSSRPEKSGLDALRARLFYQSKKRGILENDVLLGGFADRWLGRLSEPELRDYDRLINGATNEWDLFYYLSGECTRVGFLCFTFFSLSGVELKIIHVAETQCNLTATLISRLFTCLPCRQAGRSRRHPAELGLRQDEALRGREEGGQCLNCSSSSAPFLSPQETRLTH